MAKSQSHGKVIEIDGIKKIVGSLIYLMVVNKLKDNDHDDFPEIHLIYVNVNDMEIIVDALDFDRVLIIVGIDDNNEVKFSDVIKIPKMKKQEISIEDFYKFTDNEFDFKNKLDIDFNEANSFIENLYVNNNLKYNGETYFRRISSKAYQKGSSIPLSGFKAFITDLRPVNLFLTTHIQGDNKKIIDSSIIIPLETDELIHFLGGLTYEKVESLNKKLKDFYNAEAEKILEPFDLTGMTTNEKKIFKKPYLSIVGKKTSTFRTNETKYTELRTAGIIHLNHKTDSTQCRTQMTINKEILYSYKNIDINHGNLVGVSDVLNSSARERKKKKKAIKETKNIKFRGLIPKREFMNIDYKRKHQLDINKENIFNLVNAYNSFTEIAKEFNVSRSVISNYIYTRQTLFFK